MAEAAAAKLAEEAVVGCVNQIKYHFSFLSGYKDNMARLKAKVKTLEERVTNVKDEVNKAREDSQKIKNNVIDWLGRVDGIMGGAEVILKEEKSVGNGCWKGWCLHMKLRYNLSKKAMTKDKDLDAFLLEGEFQTVAHPKRAPAHVYDPTESLGIEQIESGERIENPIVQNHLQEENGTESVTFSKTADKSLMSRLSLLNGVMTAIRDPEIRLVRICGMGGIGKTTMAKEVEEITRRERLFHEVSMVEVKQNPEVKDLQDQIAEDFGLTLKEHSLSARAKWLWERLTDQGQSAEGENADGSRKVGEKKKILLILDNVWAKEDLEKVGVPLQGEKSHCKILLTARSDLICNDIEPQRVFYVKALSYSEAFALFHKSLGNRRIFYDEDMANDLVKSCGGLPISITTIAGAVKDKEEVGWSVALRKLKNSDLKDDYSKVFKCLEISYDFLKNEKIQKFFRLSCLFIKGSDISIDDLVLYGVALNLFTELDKLYEVREEARSYVEGLLHSNLLLKSDKAGCFKVHDHVWDFALLASSKELFMVKYGDALTKWPDINSYKNYTTVSLKCGNIFQVPRKVECQDLKLLQLVGDEASLCSLELTEKFFEGMPDLNVLAFKKMSISLITVKSLQSLKYLRSLSLRQCTLTDVSMIGNLGNLEVLNFAHSTIKELPTEIAKLEKLRSLDLTGCSELLVIARHVLSQLISLEELYMRGTPKLLNGGSLAIFSEIASLPTLVVIDLVLPLEVLPMNSLFSNLKKFKISINTSRNMEVGKYVLDNNLELECDLSTLLQPGIVMLQKEVVKLDLTMITGLKTLIPLDESRTLTFKKLKSLSLQSCNEVMYLVNMVDNQGQTSIFPNLVSLSLNKLPYLKDIFHGRVSDESIVSIVSPFSNLKVLDVHECHELEHIFTSSIARGLSKLEEINISHCNKLKVIFAEGNYSEGNVELPNLKKIALSELPNLVGCYIIVDSFQFPQLKKLNLDMLPLITRLVHLETETISATSNIVECPLFRHKAPHITNGLQNWASVEVSKCNNLRDLFELPMAMCLGDLHTIKVVECELLETVVAAKTRNGDTGISGTEVVLLPKLSSLSLQTLPILSRILPEGFTLRWSSLETLSVDNCGEKLVNQLCLDENYIQTGMAAERKVMLNKLKRLTIMQRASLEFLHKQIPGVFSYYSKDKDKLFFSCNSICGSQDLGDITLSNLENCEVLFPHEEDCSTGSETELVTLNKFETRQQKNFVGFRNLEYLLLGDSNSFKYIFSPSIAKCLVNLQIVSIIGCDMMEGIVSERHEDGRENLTDIDFFSNLQDLPLSGLSTQSNFTSDTSAHINSDDKQSSCTALMNLKGIEHSWSLHSLKSLEVFDCCKMSALFPSNLQVRLPVLQTLVINECGMLTYVFSSSTTTLSSLKKLKKVQVTSCEMMEVIVKVEEEEDISELIVFPSLESVILNDLPELRGICLETFANFDWISLTSLAIENCSNLRIFTSGCSTTPVLKSIVINTDSYSLCDGGGDLNDIFTTAADKDNANLALKEQGILTADGFILAGDHLIAQCPRWSWQSDNDDKIDLLPDEKQYLMGTFQHFVKRARPVSPNNIDNEADDDENILHSSRTYSILIACDDDQSLRFLMFGSDDESNVSLPFDLLLEDIAESFPRESIFCKYNNGSEAALVYIAQTDSVDGFIRNLTQTELDIQTFFQLALKAIFPTLQPCAP